MRSAALTDQQAKAVELGNGAYLVTAPPGSGKTEVLVQRVIHLLGRSPSDLFRILALTYTVKAAGELKERVQQVVPDPDQWRVNATTFHSFGLGILQNYGHPVGLKPPITVISDIEDKRLLVTPLLTDQDGPYDQLRPIDNDQWKALFHKIARRKTDLVPPDQVEEVRVLDGQVSLHQAYEAYETALTINGSVDYEGMIYQTVRLIRIDPWVASHIRRQYRHILVDEGQELTRGQYELLRAIRGDTQQNVFVVADTDQSINSFAGGGPKFLQEFVSDFDADERRLTTNFRSARLIVEALDSLRKQIVGIRRVLRTELGNLARGWIGARSYADEESEARAISEWIRRLLKDGLDASWVYEGEATDIEPEDICLLGRTRYAFTAVVTELENHSVPVVQRIEQGALFESCLGRWGYDALKLMENPGNLPAKRRLLDDLGGEGPPRSGHADEPEGTRFILQAFADHGRMPDKFVEAFIPPDDVSANGLQIISRLAELDLSMDQYEMAAWHRDQQLLQQSLTDYEVRTSAPNRSLSGFLRTLARLEETPLSAQAVRALTPYRARGLEFKVVVVLGMNEGTFPFYRATSADELDEERRVVYVAASRAARALLFTRPRKRRSRFGNWYGCHESRFISEMGLTMRDQHERTRELPMPGGPDGIRTRVSGLKGQRPRPAGRRGPRFPILRLLWRCGEPSINGGCCSVTGG